jgi:hypothetical protein
LYNESNLILPYTSFTSLYPKKKIRKLEIHECIDFMMNYISVHIEPLKIHESSNVRRCSGRKLYLYGISDRY